MNNSIFAITTAILFMWLAVLTLLFVRSYFASRRILNEGKNKSITQILENVFKKEEENTERLKKLESRLSAIEKESSLHFQKMGMLRFNPFKDTGGDQSFILALVDAQDTGIIISSLHTRTGTRWYAKKVTHGEGVEYSLSDEEKKTLKEAKMLG